MKTLQTLPPNISSHDDIKILAYNYIWRLAIHKFRNRETFYIGKFLLDGKPTTRCIVESQTFSQVPLAKFSQM